MGRGIKLLFARCRTEVAAYTAIFNLGFSFFVGVHELLLHRGEPHAWDAILVLIVPPIIFALCVWLPGEEA
jgi:lipopolysaccharide export LptBFGC system permease protein LptF